MKVFDSKLSHVSILPNVLYITRDTSESSDSSPDIIFSSILFIVVVLRLMLPLKFVSQATRTHTQTYYKIFILDHKWFERQCSRGSATSEVTRNKSKPSSKKKLYFTMVLKMQSRVVKHRYPTLLTIYKGKSAFIIKQSSAKKKKKRPKLYTFYE